MYLDKEMVYRKIVEVLAENGVDAASDASLKEMDSLTYISAISELEECFQTDFPDSMLVRNMFINIDDMCELILFLTGNGSEEEKECDEEGGEWNNEKTIWKGGQTSES